MNENSIHRARFWENEPDGKVKCLLCPHYCQIAAGRGGRCLARKNSDGVLVSDTYGKITSIALDPIEKKPLYYYYPGKNILSVGSYGCNLNCMFCQNWTIARQKADYEYLLPEELAKLAEKYRNYDSIGVAYTYNEPLINWEYIFDSAKKVREAGLKNILVTNGYINPRPMLELLPYIDAMNIDLKAFNEDFYHNVCGGSLQPVLETISNCAPECHVEVATLLIPGYNDSDKEIEKLSLWLANIDSGIPLHLTRHHPAYKMKQPEPIEVGRMHHLADIARKYLSRVKLGNI